MNEPPQPRSRNLGRHAVVVAIDSNYEFATAAAFDYRQQNVYPYIENQGFFIERCQGKLARRCYVEPAVINPNVEYLTGVGHGSHDAFTGDQYHPIFKIGDYKPEESQGKIIHLLSCNTAAQLGSDLVEHGCRAFFGYDIEFTFTTKTANIFFECDSEIDRAFAEGLTAEQVHQRVIALYQQRADECFEQGDLETYKYLQTDCNHLCSPSVDRRWGESQARLE